MKRDGVLIRTRAVLHDDFADIPVVAAAVVDPSHASEREGVGFHGSVQLSETHPGSSYARCLNAAGVVHKTGNGERTCVVVALRANSNAEIAGQLAFDVCVAGHRECMSTTGCRRLVVDDVPGDFEIAANESLAGLALCVVNAGNGHITRGRDGSFVIDNG